ncbi:SCO family protein [Brevibacillus sp. H7]|uniref:SCO family protein n=1 Tax=Brevibacillus sp. H7 TaxID=3349138 RepID=UPI0037F190A5
MTNFSQSKSAYTVRKLLLALVLIGLAGMVFSWVWTTISQRETAKTLPDLPFETLSGQTITLGETAGTIRLVELMYTRCPDVCPLTTVRMKELQERLKQDGSFGKDVQFLTITFDPKNDTREALQKYVNQLQLDLNGWHFLRGGEEQTKSLITSLGFTVKGIESNLYTHSTVTYLVDQKNRVIKTYGMGEDFNTDQLSMDITSLLKKGNQP